MDSFVRRRQRYLVTDRHILIVTGWPLHRRTSLDIERLPALDLHERRDGSGTIDFGTDTVGPRGSRKYGPIDPALAGTPQFPRIDNVRRLYDLIDRAGRQDQSAASAAAGPPTATGIMSTALSCDATR